MSYTFYRKKQFIPNSHQSNTILIQIPKRSMYIDHQIMYDVSMYQKIRAELYIDRQPEQSSLSPGQTDKLHLASVFLFILSGTKL